MAVSKIANDWLSQYKGVRFSFHCDDCSRSFSNRPLVGVETPISPANRLDFYAVFQGQYKVHASEIVRNVSCGYPGDILQRLIEETRTDVWSGSIKTRTDDLPTGGTGIGYGGSFHNDIPGDEGHYYVSGLLTVCRQ